MVDGVWASCVARIFYYLLLFFLFLRGYQELFVNT